MEERLEKWLESGAEQTEPAASSRLAPVTTVDDADSQTFDAVLVLYLACAKLPDGALDATEGARILQLTEQHTRGLAPGYAERALRDAAGDFAALGSPAAQLARVVEAAERVASTLDSSAKEQLVAELRSIASADGEDTAAEHEFVAAAAKTLGVS